MVARGNSMWSLLMLLVACGRTDHDAGSYSRGANDGGGTTGASGSASEGGVASTGGEPQSCLYPRKGLTLAGADSGAETFQLSAPFAIDVTPARWGGLAAAYDLNGDAVSDLIYQDGSSQHVPRRLALSSPPPNELTFRDSECRALAELPEGRLFLRDLDADGVLDFVVGTATGVQAFVNQATGLKQVLDYQFPAPVVRASVLNVGAIDLYGDELAELVVGFDLLRDEKELSVDLGVIGFAPSADGKLAPGQLFSANSSHGMAYDGELHPGYLAVGRFDSGERGSAILVGDPERPLGTVGDRATFGGPELVPLVVPEVDEPIYQLFALPDGLGHSYLLALGKKTFYVLDLSESPRLVTRAPLATTGGYSHEIGGGSEQPRFFVYDLDRDGDADFIERIAIDEDAVYIHANLQNLSFAPPQRVSLSVFGEAESPFVTVGPGSGIIAHPDPLKPDAATYTLMPALPPATGK